MKVQRAHSVAIWGLLFAVVGAAFSFAAFMSGIADTGYATGSWRTIILFSVACWPSLVFGWTLVAVGIFHSFESFAEASPMLYSFGLPAIGWGVVGSSLGLWILRRNDESRGSRQVGNAQ
jgi:hypothetical protein